MKKKTVKLNESNKETLKAITQRMAELRREYSENETKLALIINAVLAEKGIFDKTVDLTPEYDLEITDKIENEPKTE